MLVAAGMLDHVNVTSHGVLTPLSHVAAVSVSSLETLTVMPYDASVSLDDSNIRCFYWLNQEFFPTQVDDSSDVVWVLWV